VAVRALLGGSRALSDVSHCLLGVLARKLLLARALGEVTLVSLSVTSLPEPVEEPHAQNLTPVGFGAPART